MTQSASPLQNATQTKLYGLDHLRTLAITLVLVYHYGRIFPHPEWTSGKAGNYASDLRSASGLPMVWNVDLQADPVGSQVVLTWQGDPAILARSQLTDTLTGKVINPADPQWAKGYPVTLTTSVRHLTWSYLGR